MCTVRGSGAKKRKTIGFWSAMARWNGYVEGSAQHANTCGYWCYKKKKGVDRCLVEPQIFEKKGGEKIGSEVRFWVLPGNILLKKRSLTFQFILSYAAVYHDFPFLPFFP